MPLIVQINPSTPIVVDALPSIANDTSVLIYTGGGGALFPILQNDTVLEPGIYHEGNPFVQQTFSTVGSDNLSVSVETKEILSKNMEKGLFDIEYPLTGPATANITYYWDKVYTTPLGIYKSQNSPSSWALSISQEVLFLYTNDVNIIPRANDYIVINAVPTDYTFFSTTTPNTPPVGWDGTSYVNGYLNSRLVYFKGMETMQAQIVSVLVYSGVGTNILFKIVLDKSINLPIGSNFALTLLNRHNTDIQKDLFYDTFQALEVHREQLIGDPYNNTSLVTLPSGRKNYLQYSGANSLGYANILNNIVNGQSGPLMFFDINDEVKDRFSYIQNTYDSNLNPVDIHFEIHLPGVLINDNVYGSTSSPVDGDGNVLENIFVASSSVLEETVGIGKYAGLYLKTDTAFTNRYGFVLYDLRLVVIDHSELVLAMGYNSNRNYTLPAPSFVPGSGNSLVNTGVGEDLNITNASNTSPIVITTSAAHKLQRGTKVLIKDVQGNTNANGEWFVDLVYTDQTNPYTFEIWQQLPQYNPDGTRVVPVGGIPIVGNGIFINNGVGNSGTVIGALPDYNYFYTYRVRNVYQPSTLPYANITNFNFTKGGNIDNQQGSLFVTIPQFNWAQGSGSLNNGQGFSISNLLNGYGIEVIVGKYTTSSSDPNNPNAITGIQDVMCIPLNNINGFPNISFTGDPTTGITFELKAIQSYQAAVTSSNTIGGVNYTYDIFNNFKIYSYNTSGTSVLPATLLTGNGVWTIGNLKFRNLAEVYRTTLSVSIPADSWNDSTNPTYNPADNSFITDKFISEIALVGDATNKPMIYAKVAPVIRKTNNLDVICNLTIDF